MRTNEIKNIRIAKRYANALFDSAVEEGKSIKIYDDLVFIQETIDSNEELKSVLSNPTISITDKKEIVRKIFAIHTEKISIDFIYLLLENSRLDCLNGVIECYNQSENKRNNVVVPLITSAIELSEKQKESLIAKLTSKMNKTIKPVYKVNSEIIGGLVIEIDDKTIDCSIAAKFENMKRQLTKGKKYGSD